jgi:hypothetical protein
MDKQTKDVLAARKLLDQLKELDRLVHRAYFEMGRILSALKHHKLWDVLGYESFQHMIEEELTVTPSTCHCYIAVYDHSRRLKYTDKETVNNIEEIGLRVLSRLLPTMKEKIGVRALANRKEQLERSVSFWLTPDEMYELESLLIDHGLVIENGRWKNSTEAFMALVASKQRKAA